MTQSTVRLSMDESGDADATWKELLKDYNGMDVDKGASARDVNVLVSLYSIV